MAPDEVRAKNAFEIKTLTAIDTEIGKNFSCLWALR